MLTNCRRKSQQEAKQLTPRAESGWAQELAKAGVSEGRR